MELYRGDKEEGKQQLRERGSLDPALVETVRALDLYSRYSRYYLHGR